MNRNDRKIVLSALATVVIALTATYLMGNDHDKAAPASADSTALPHHHGYDNSHHQGTDRSPQYFATPSQKTERFPFDPNTADSIQLLRLGLKPWQVRNIYKYRAQGGVYRKKEDFARLYGLTVGQYRELEPYIRIGADYLPASTLVKSDSHFRHGNGDTLQPGIHMKGSQLSYPVKLKGNEQVVLNSADTSELQRIPGIGPYYARQIVRYGERLGGYVSVSQLDEIDDLPSDIKQYVTIDHATPQRLNINRLSMQQLRRHPYINYYRAKAIADYRRLHGPITSLEQLSLSPDFPPDIIKKLEPYIEY